MLDIIDKIIKSHIEQLLTAGQNKVPVFSISTADTDDMLMTQAGMSNTPDTIELPVVSLIRLPSIEITDDAITKRVHNYQGYNLLPNSDTKLTYYRCTLHYNATIFAETRKVSEDLATQLFSQLRNNCQVVATIQLPIMHPDFKDKYVAVQMDSDIEMGQAIEQKNPQSLDKSQLYKCHISFDIKNVNIYNFVQDKPYAYNVVVSAKTEGSHTISESIIKNSRPITGISETISPQEIVKTKQH